MAIEGLQVYNDFIHGGVDMDYFVYKEVHFMVTGVYDHMLKSLIHNYYQGGCSEFYPRYQNKDNYLKDIVVDKRIN